MSSIKAYTYNMVNGKVEKTKLSKKNIFDEKLNKNNRRKKITMPNVKEGSVIEIKYRLTSPYYQSIDDLTFQYNIPVKKLEYKVSVPEYFKFNKRVKGYHYIPMNITPKSGASGGLRYSMNEIKFDSNDVPALRDDEPYVDNVNNYRSGMAFELTAITIPGELQKYFSITWKDVVKTIYKSQSFGDELKKTSYFKEDLAAVLSSIKSELEKIGAIFNFVTSKVKWNGYYGFSTDKGVRQAYKDGQGNVADINLMLVSMLKEAGLNASPVLVSTRSNGFSYFPTIDGFNYVIAAVNLNGNYILMDASAKFSTPNVLPLRAINWQGRIIKEDLSSDWISLKPNVYSSKDHFLSLVFNEDFESEGFLRTTYRNLDAINYRSNNNHLKEDGVISKLENDFNIEVDDYKVINKDLIYKPVIRNIKFSGEDLVETINGKVYITPLLFLTSTKNPFKMEERKFPIDFGVPFKNKISVSIQIPEGYKVETLPESTAIAMRNKIGQFVYKVVSRGKKVNVILQFHINQPIVTPEYYKELKEFFNLMVKKQTEKIVLVRK